MAEFETDLRELQVRMWAQEAVLVATLAYLSATNTDLVDLIEDVAVRLDEILPADQVEEVKAAVRRLTVAVRETYPPPRDEDGAPARAGA